MQSVYFSSDDERAYCRHIKERTQKITEAMYRVSELFSEKEPLRWQLRQAALRIFNDFSAFEALSLSSRAEAIRSAPGHISRICSLIDLASAGSLISHFNFDVLRREYTALLSFIIDHKSLLGTVELPKLNLPVFSEKTSEDSGEALLKTQNFPTKNSASEAVQANKSEYIGHDFNGHSIRQNESPIDINNVRYGNHVPKKQEFGHQQEQQKNVMDRSEKDYGQEQEKFSVERKHQILRFMKMHGWVSIGDLASVFKGKISEKTLQRDLVGMTERGILKKEGDKRWRRYIINTNINTNTGLH